MKRHIDLTEGSLGRHILRMTPPMIMGFFAMMVFNLTDAWFVSRLGTVPLAAIGFTFPLVMIFYSIGLGLGVGTSSCVSRAIGQKNPDRVKHLTTYSLLLTLLTMSVMSVLGQIFAPSLLRLMGAGGDTLGPALIYMRIWFCFVPFAVLPMVGNNAIRSTGDTLRPGLVMAVGALLNIGLDPLFIFGLGRFPAMGIAGAAIATGIARVVTLALSIWLLHFRFRMLSWIRPVWNELLEAWRSVLFVAAPAAATNLLLPITSGVIIHFISGFGVAAVAATTAGQRIEGFAYMVPMAMGTGLIPIIGQNWGAERLDRVHGAWVRTNWYGIIYALICVIAALFFAPVVAGWFSRDPKVIHFITLYLRIILAGAVLQHSSVHTGFAFNAIELPWHSSALMAIRLAGFVIPLAWIGSRVAGVPGIFTGMALGQGLSGVIALCWFSRILKKKRTA
ncbi:MAG: MATE family efflux transporter [Kiritimatiellales bacterium]